MANSKQSAAPSPRVRVKRLHERGHYDAETIHGILDAMPICSVGYVFNGQPYVTPTLQWREGNHMYWHGSSASRMLETVDEADVCVTVALIDGFVMARSAFHHSANYRSVMALGRARKVKDRAKKEARLKTFVDTLFPGRWDMLRPMNAQEFKATTVLSLPLSEASAKIRTGGPKDDEEDYALPIWAGVIPVTMQVGTPIDDPRNLAGVLPPDHVKTLRLG
ncbi:MAG: pyridoxamine 5'-phosphate oxidase family protein [Rhizobiales bacterium]|nr:pyridoxamine 5'-phosphate oxidase family protein [Hyphomicrobiales bacterium]